MIAEYKALWWNVFKKAEETALQEVIKSSDGRDIDVVDQDGQTALLFVSRLCSEQCIKLLAEEGVNVNHRDNNGKLMALHMADDYVRPEVAKVLLDFGLNLL
ncbi:Signal recognition particle 43 kDa protein [Forsythia ovata]|uniref:Signal recognition particle 43 kDa protein n=1 Tax=Forsythia ovata TaxID=205694 RepID=A0ABD1QLF6_9LAMI